MELLNRRNAFFAGCTALGLALDQASKAWIVANVTYGVGEIPVIPGFLSIVHAQNPGAAFGMFGGYANRHLVFGVFTVLALGVVADMFRKLPTNDRFMASALGLILSGALGNAIDRVRQAYVTDFIRVYTEIPAVKGWLVQNFGTYEWPSFNIADAALVVGVGMFVVHWAVWERGRATDPAAGGPTTG